MSEPSLEPARGERDQIPLPPAPEPISIDLATAGGLPRSAQRKYWTASLIAAFAAHAVILFAVEWRPTHRQVGAGGIELEAIGVDIVSAQVFESRFAVSDAGSAAPEAVDHAAEGSTATEASSDAADQMSSTPEDLPATAGPQPDLVIPDVKQAEQPPEPTDVALAIADARPVVPDLNEPEPEPEPERHERLPESATPSAPSEARAASEDGGSAARGMEIERSKGQQATAGAGVANEYAQAVIQTLARRKPRVTAGIRGTVRIRFTVGSSGEVREARVLSSSGRKVLDEAALSAVQQARFPAPPPALANASLSYEIPYIFR